jgi:hypothetical protein
MLLKHHNLQKILFGENVFDDHFCKVLKLQHDNVKEIDDFQNAIIFKIYEDLTHTRDVVYIGSTCDTLSKCMSKFRIMSKSRVIEITRVIMQKN